MFSSSENRWNVCPVREPWRGPINNLSSVLCIVTSNKMASVWGSKDGGVIEGSRYTFRCLLGHVVF